MEAIRVRRRLVYVAVGIFAVLAAKENPQNGGSPAFGSAGLVAFLGVVTIETSHFCWKYTERHYGYTPVSSAFAWRSLLIYGSSG